MKVLIMGLPGSGKTTLANEIKKHIPCKHYNADDIRKEYNDWDFSDEGRDRQARRMGELSKGNEGIVICDFVCPKQDNRTSYGADFTIFMDTIKKGVYEDTNKIFERPTEYNIIFTEFNDNNVSQAITEIVNHYKIYLINLLNSKKEIK